MLFSPVGDDIVGHSLERGIETPIPTYLASHIISNNPRYTYLGSVHIESIVLIERMIDLLSVLFVDK